MFVDEQTKRALWLESCRFHPSLYFANDENVIEAGLGSLISFEKEMFLGKEAVEKIHLKCSLVYFQSNSKQKPKSIITHNGAKVGYIVACEYSPLLNKYVGNVYMQNGYAASGAKFGVKDSQTTVLLVSAPHILGKSYLEVT